jgi:hypothetical protein
MGLEGDPLSLVSTTEELLERKSIVSGPEKSITAVGDLPSSQRYTPLTAKVGLTSPTSGCRSVSIVRSRTKTTELLLLVIIIITSY